MSNTSTEISSSEIASIDAAQLGDVTGAGIGTTIGSMFGAKGQQWGQMADNIMGQLGPILGQLGGGGGGGAAPAAGGQ